MNATEDLGWMDSPAALADCVERVKTVKALGLDVGVDFHGRVHKPMAKQLARLLEPHQPMFIEEPLLSEHLEGIKALSQLTVVPVALGERLHSRWDFKRFLGPRGQWGARATSRFDRSVCEYCRHNLLVKNRQG